MSYDVVVVGGGIGGLTVAALLSARGLSVCLLERQSQVGGCVSRVEFSGLEFEPGMSLYADWGPGEIHERIFSELRVSSPASSLLTSDYVVRLADQTDVKLIRDDQSFFTELGRAFPECVDEAIEFYSTVKRTANSWRRALSRNSGAGVPGIGRAIHALWPKAAFLPETEHARGKTALDFAGNASGRFKSFVDAQLRAFAQTPVERCAFLPASIALTTPRDRLYSIHGGPAALAERLAEAIRRAGGMVRLNSPVLRLAYNAAGDAPGVDLLSGETVSARRAIISNLTIWDTYGKLVGLTRTPPEIRKKLASLQGAGAYLIYASMGESAATRIPSEHLLVAPEWPRLDDDSSAAEFTLTLTEAAAGSAPMGKRAATIQSATDVAQWFSFQSSNEDYQHRDQTALETLWARLHRWIPELGGDIEVVETANPRTFYDLTRRKLGMVLGVEQTADSITEATFRTSLPNLFIVSDTVSGGASLAAVSRLALRLANELTR